MSRQVEHRAFSSLTLQEVRTPRRVFVRGSRVRQNAEISHFGECTYAL